MNEHMPGGGAEGIPDWEELKDEELDPGIREDLLGFAKINEETFWTEEELEKKLEEDPLLPIGLWFGFQILLDSHGIRYSEAERDAALRRYNELSNRILSDKNGLKDRARAIQGAKRTLATLGFSEEELSAKETLKRAYFGHAEDRSAEALQMLKKAAEEDPGLKGALEQFDREARERERHERGQDLR